MLAQITCQIHSKENTPTPPLTSFLPYPQAVGEELESPLWLVNLVMHNKSKLKPELLGVMEDSQISEKIAMTYYWGNGAWMYA